MKKIKEITVKINCNFKSLDKQLKVLGFKKIRKYYIKDIYLLPININIKKEKVLNILNKCILIRNINNSKKFLTYKYKKYSNNGDIIEQGKIECIIKNVDSALKFMKAINYKELLEINDELIVYSNKKIELSVQLVNDKYIFIEMEDNDSTIEEMIKKLESTKLDYDHSNYFVKKAEIIFNELYINKKK